MDRDTPTKVMNDLSLLASYDGRENVASSRDAEP